MEWKEVRLGDVCAILDSKRIPLSAMQRAKRQGSYRYYGAQGIIDYVDDYLFDGEYLLVAEDGANLTTRNQNIANLVTGKFWVNNHAHILGNNGKCPLNLLGFILNNTNISAYVTGCAQPKLNQENLRNIPIKLPSNIEFVASILSSLDRKIELNNKINAQLEEMAQAIFKSWFVDFEPFKDGKFVESELGMIPEGWRVGTLGEVIDVKYGKDHKKLQGGSIPVYGSGGLMRHVDKALYEGESVLIPRKGTLNNVMYVNDSFWTVDTMFYSIPKMEDIVLMVYLYLCTKDLASMNAGSAVPSMTTDILNRMCIVIPEQEVCRNFNNVVKQLYTTIKSKQKENLHLSQLRDTLLPKLMSGEIEI